MTDAEIQKELHRAIERHGQYIERAHRAHQENKNKK